MKYTNDIFEKIKAIISNIIIDYNIIYPIDVYQLCEKMDFKLISYTSINNNLLNKLSNDGFTYYNDKIKQWYIYYNDINIYKERIKFTIAHEIGHIIMLTNDEKLANFFAAYLLVPVPLIITNKLDSANQIMYFFKIGYDCANASLDRAKKRLKIKKSFNINEKKIIESQNVNKNNLNNKRN